MKDIVWFFAVFLSEVVESLTRGFQEKSNPDFLILEINSSRYAYNMSLKEVNFNVVKAIFSLPSIKEPLKNNVLLEISAVLKQLGPVMSNYIKSEEAMLDCLKALEVGFSFKSVIFMLLIIFPFNRIFMRKIFLFRRKFPK